MPPVDGRASVARLTFSFTRCMYDIVVDEDGWSIFTTDSSLAAHFEHTVAITDDGPRILTLAQGTSIVDAEI